MAKRKAKFRAGQRYMVTMEVTLVRRLGRVWAVFPRQYIHEKELRRLTAREAGRKGR